MTARFERIEAAMFRCTAKDANGIPRCYGIDPTRQKAETQARWAVKAYAKRRRENAVRGLHF